MSWFEDGASRIYYEESGAGDPVLLLPGFSDRIEGHVALRRALVPGNRVIAADLPGSGRSGPQPREYTASYLADDARAFADLLRTLNTGPTHLLGFSDGGEVALLMAEQAPDLVRSVMTWGACGTISDPDGQLREVMRTVVDHPIPPMQGYRDYLVATYGEANARAITQNLVKAMDAIIAAGGDLSAEKAGDIACPALLIAGEYDMFVPRALLDTIAPRLQHGETIVVEGAGHDVHNARPEWFTRTVLDWLAKH
ncbi:MAG TPA: alpha/beta hydrolase [Ktedonobacterales bacterium]|nr:alpha/beta hydrolase [Ktedonobacterales bacterium]